MAASGITQTIFTVNNSISDSVAPVITGLTLGSTVLNPSQPGGASLTASLGFTDNLSGFDYAHLRFKSASTNQYLYIYLSTYDSLLGGTTILNGTTLNGVMSGSTPLSPYAASGTWDLDSIEIYDKANNFTSAVQGDATWSSYLAASGITQTTFTVVNASSNLAPTNLTLTSSGLLENSAAATVIGTLSATDPDAGSTFTYALVAGNGTNDADNNLVEIANGNEVRVKFGVVIDFETNPVLNLNIRVTDNGDPGLTFIKAVTASVINVNEAPTDLIFITSGIQENSLAGTVIGTLSGVDPDAGSTFSYALVTGNGINDADNALVDIVGNEVRVKSGVSIDFETNPVLNLNIRVTDNGNPGRTYTKAVTASVSISVIERLSKPAFEWFVDRTELFNNFNDFTQGQDGSIYVSGQIDKAVDGQPYNGGWDGSLVKYSPNGDLLWTRVFGSSAFESAYNVQASVDGSIYVAGLTTGGFGSQASRGMQDIFISKYSSSGTTVWTRILGSGSNEYIDTMVVGADGNIFVSGGTFGSLNGQINKGGSDAYVIKINPNGQTEWTTLLGTTQYDEVREIALGSSGSIYVCGETYGNYNAFPNNGVSDVFLSKLRSDGVTEWSRLLGSASNDYVNAIGVDKLGNIYIAGETSGSLDGQESKGSADAFLTKYSSSGDKEWTRLLGTSRFDYANSIAVSDDNSIFVSGYTSSVSVGGTGYDSFLAKFTSDGNLVWQGLLGASAYGTSQEILAKGDAIYIGANVNDSTFYGSKFNLGIDQGFGSPLAITGNNFFTEGVTLIAGDVRNDPDGDSSNPNYKYQWLLNGNAIQGETSKSLKTNLFGGAGVYSVDFTYTDAKGFVATVTSPVKVVEQTSKTFNITFSTVPTEGFGFFITSINLSAGNQLSGNLAEGAKVWWKVTGITADDLALNSDGLTGSGIITNGKLDIQHSLKQDVDKGENFEISVFSDASMTQQIGVLNSVVVIEGDGTLSPITGNGLFNEGVMLAAGTVSGDPDGTAVNPAYSYQWYLNGSTIGGATSASYAVGAQGTGTYKVAVTYTDGQSYTTTLTSADQVVAKIDNGQGTLSPITGNGALNEGVTLTAGSVSGDLDGNGTINTYQWYRNGTAISNATAASYLVPIGGAGTYTVQVSHTDGQGYSTILTSTGTVVTSPPPPLDTTAPTLSSISVQGTTVILQFSEAFTATAVPLTAFAVATVNTSNTPTNRTITAVTLNQNDSRQLILSLSGTAPASSVNLRVSYTDPAGNQTSGVVQDLAGNDLASFSNRFADTFITGSTTTLASQYQNLILTGTSGVSGTGNALGNTITGNSSANTLSGLAGNDTLIGGDGNDTLIGGTGVDLLTGGLGTDTFRFALADSLLGTAAAPGYDRITGFAIGTDRIDGPSAVTAANLAELGRVNSLDQAGISAVLSSTTFLANRAATFTWVDGTTTRTFLALNNGTAGYQSASDAIIDITGYTGDLSRLAVI